MSENIEVNKKLMWLKKLEPYYFYLFLLLNLLPIVCYKFFPTADGPAHLYNSRIIVELIENSNSPIHQFINFNPNLTSNCLGHYILSFFLVFLPGFVAEKIILTLYLVGLPLSIRHLFKTIEIKNNYLIYLVFPFTYSFLFYYGFYNFNIGLVFLFYGLSLWLKYYKQLSFFRVITLMLISALICLSHLFIFLLFLIIVFILSLKEFVLSNQFKTIKLNSIKTYLLQFVYILPGLIIAFHFFSSTQSVKTTPTYIPFADIVTSLKYIMPSKGINYDGYNLVSRIILYVFTALFIYIIASTIKSWVTKKQIMLKNNIWFFICALVLVGLFSLPDSYVSAGFISSRLMLLFFLFFIIWIASQDIPLWFRALVFLLVNFVNISILIHNYKSVSTGCYVAKEINSASKFIQPYSTVMPINTSTNFLYSHISNYLGSDNPMIILENYEATLEYFPLKWNHEKADKLISGDFKNIDNINKFINSKITADINYVIVIEDNRSERIDSILGAKYVMLYAGNYGNIRLFKNKQYK